jgi:alkaline phosphatase D
MPARAVDVEWEVAAYRRLADEHPDLVVHLGDYQYEYGAGKQSGAVREHVGPETVTLANHRQRYAQYKTDPDLQAAHAAAPWLAVFDDHEVANNWAGEVPDNPEPAFLDRRAAALQAYYENMPLRSASVPRGIDMQLYRRVHWGALATFHMLDTRQYRTHQPCGDEFRSDCLERLNPAASLTGAGQERWLLNGFQESRSQWDLLGQQVFFSQVELTPGPGRGFNPDAWDGYPVSRDRIVAGRANSPVRNAVVLTGDVHSRAILPENPHIRYFNGRRGYVRARITAEDMRADFRVLPYVSHPGAPVQTAASFVVPDRDPALHAM